MKIPNFTIEREIGQGGMATVYLARHVLLDRQVALKVMDPSLGREKGFLDKFLDEGRIVARLEHPNIVRVYDVGIVEDISSVYMAMEYLPGGSLKERLASGRLTLEDTLKVLEQVGAGLGLAHQQGFIHRDIKPANILFRKDGVAVLTDFGIAKLQDSVGELTRMGYTLGTVKYMSPEQASTTRLDSRSDIYSLGLVFYEMLTGKAAVAAESTAQAIHSHVALPPPQLPPEYAWLQAVLNKVLAKAPGERYATVDEFINAVRNTAPEKTLLFSAAAVGADAGMAATRPTQVVAPDKSAGGKHWWVSSLLGLLLVGLFAGVFYASSGFFNGDNGHTLPSAPPIATDAGQLVGGDGVFPSLPGEASALREKVNLVFDASGSMKEKVGGIPKITIAKDVLKNVVAGWDDATERGLLVYGHRQSNDCNDIEQVVPVGRGNKQDFINKADALNAKGETPIAKALLMAAQDLKYTEGKATVILVSDGKEECGGDPCVVARELEQRGIDFTAHVIGFDVQDKAARDQLQCIAEATGGNYQAAKDREEFQAMLTASQSHQGVTASRQPTVSPPPPAVTTGVLKVSSISSRTGKPLVADISVLAEQKRKVTEATFKLKAGKYRVNVRTDEDEKNFDVTVTAGKTVSRSIKLEDPLPDIVPPPEPDSAFLILKAVDKTSGKALSADFTVTQDGKQVGKASGSEANIGKLVAGTYRISAVSGKLARGSAEVTLKAGERSEVVIELKGIFIVPPIIHELEPVKPVIPIKPVIPVKPEVIKPVIPIKPEVVKPVIPIKPEVIKPLKPIKPEVIKPLTPAKPETTELAKPAQPVAPAVTEPHPTDALKQKLQGELFKRLDK